MSAHDHMLESRIQEYNTIIDSHTYKSEVSDNYFLLLCLIDIRMISNRPLILSCFFLIQMTKNILYHDYIVWMGDLNFRLLEKTLSHDEIVHEIESSNLNVLQKHDQLKHVQNKNSAFQELTESEINFPPTFKHVIGSDDYDTKRRPAWTDRILHRVNSYNLEDIGKKLMKLGSPGKNVFLLSFTR